MPKEEIKVEVEEIKKPAADSASDVSIEFGDNGEPVKKEEAKKEAAPSFSPEILNIHKTEIEKKLNSHFYTQRKKDEEIDRQLKEISQRLQGAVVPKQEGPKSEWDEKVQKNWKVTVEELADLRAEAKFKQLMAEQDNQRKINDEQQRVTNLRQENIKKALVRHPELDDNGSEKSQLYREILTQNPDYLTDPRGPTLAMHDMEDELRSQGKLVDEPTRRIVEKEIVRQTRAAASQAPAGAKSKGNVIVLTKEEKEFCDNHNLKYESYARSKKMIGQKEGVEA